MARVFAGVTVAFIVVTSAWAQAPLTVGQTFTIQSKSVGEARRINVWTPPVYTDSSAVKLPVLYMPDGGVAEDFVHIMGLLQVSIGNGTMRPFILVGIENTQRRRDMTGPTQNAEDKKIAAVVGGSAAFRAFIRDELKPYINAHYRTTRESAIIGESLAGLFIVETMFLEADLFDTYIAFDPSLWWNDSDYIINAQEKVRKLPKRQIRFWYAGSADFLELGQAFGRALKADAPPTLDWTFDPLVGERHSTIYHPAALRAVRKLFPPR